MELYSYFVLLRSRRILGVRYVLFLELRIVRTTGHVQNFECEKHLVKRPGENAVHSNSPRYVAQ